MRRCRWAAVGVLSAGVFASVASPATARMRGEVVQFSTGVSAVVLEGDTQDDDIRMIDPGGGIVRFFSRESQTSAGPGCTATTNLVDCQLQGNTNTVSIRGGFGRDTITVAGTPLALNVSGGEGPDVVSVSQAVETASLFETGLDGNEGDDIITGSPTNDSIAGGAGDDLLRGADGNDRVDGGLGGDEMEGGAGVDEATYLVDGFRTPRSIGITVQAGDGVCNDGSEQDVVDAGRPQLSNRTSTCGAGAGVERDGVAGDLETIIATNGTDSIIGSGADNTVFGLGGTDQLEGGGGVDALVGEGVIRATGSTAGPDGNDLLLLRDNLTDGSSSCGAGAADRAVGDQPDPISNDCEVVERGAAGVTGPPSNGAVGSGTVGGQPEPGQPSADPEPIEAPPAPPPGTPPTGNETGGDQPGGGDGGDTPPELKIFGDTLLIDSKRRAQARITCVYRAAECEGTATLSAAKDVGKGKKEIEKGTRIGDAEISIPWGRTGDVQIKVSKDFTKALGDKSTTLTLKVSARDSGAGRDAAVAKAKRKLKTELAG